MKIKNGDIELINTLLTKEVTVSAKDNRLRGKFLRKLLTHYKEDYIPQRTDTVKYFATKDENNKPIGNGNSFEISKDKLFLCQVQLDELDNEYFVIEDSPTNKELFETVYKIITDDSFKVEGELSIVHDELCEELELSLEKLNKVE